MNTDSFINFVENKVLVEPDQIVKIKKKISIYKND